MLQVGQEFSNHSKSDRVASRVGAGGQQIARQAAAIEQMVEDWAEQGKQPKWSLRPQLAALAEAAAAEGTCSSKEAADAVQLAAKAAAAVQARTL